MEIDLERHDASTEPFRSQVCVVGAGIAGLTIAHRLSLQGIDVALLEAGGRELSEASQSFLAQAKLSGQAHLGTIEGRFRAFGGSSLRWGGQVLPLPPLRYVASAVPHSIHLEASPSYSEVEAWPLRPDTLTPFYCIAENLLEVDDLPFDGGTFFGAKRLSAPPLLARLPGVTTRLSKWAAFDRRNFANTFAKDVEASRSVRVYLHAQAVELGLAGSRDRIESVKVRTLGGNEFRFEAEHFIVTAGTVETSRLLLASRNVAREGVGNANDQVGRGFQDHLTVTAATLRGEARARLLREFRPWVFGATLHSIKLEAGMELRQDLALNPILAHLTLEEPEDTGLAVVRKILQARQSGKIVAELRANAAKLPAALVESLRLAWFAKVRHRRFVSADTVVRLQLNAVQDLPATSRITLSTEMDAFGLPEPDVDWRITEHELATFRRFAAHLREHLEGAGLGGFEWLPELFAAEGPMPSVTDARHAMGGACMGVDPRSSVVDTDLRVHGVANLSIASAAVFPNGNAQLPTLPLMALSVRLADRVASELQR